jgi:hypothetical protein
MDTVKKAVDVLRNAEINLRDVIAQAAAEGEYSNLLQVTGIAKVLNQLIRDADSRDQVKDSVTLASPNVQEPVPIAVQNRAGTKSRSKKLINSYPQFFRKRDFLIKIGWSKREKAEYDHKAPRVVLDTLSSSLIKEGAGGKLFEASQLLPLKDPTDGSEIPSYQVYLCLAWLRSLNLIEQIGRQGYKLHDPTLLEGKIKSCWERLESR